MLDKPPVTTSLEASAATRWLRAGHSTAPDAVSAAEEVLAQVLDGPGAPSLLVLFADHAYDLDLLVSTVHAGGGCELIGCSTAGEIMGHGAADGGVALAAFGGEGFATATAGADRASSGMREAGRRAARAFDRLDRPRENTVLLTFTDTFAGDQQEVLRGIYQELGAQVPVVGGCAGDSLLMQRTFQFHNDRVLTDAVVAAAVSSDGPFGIGARHGWRTVGEPMIVTASEGTVILEFDARPALDVYLERHSLPTSITDDPDVFMRFAMRHPLALARRSGEPLVRFLTGACPETNGLLTLAAVPEGANVWLMTGDEESVLQATHGACDEAFRDLPPGAATGVLVFDCVTRRDMLGDAGIAREIDVISERAGGAPVVGLFTYGELARTRGINGLHHETLVVLAVG